MDAELRAYLDERFGAIDQRFDAVDQRFGTIDQRFVAIDQRFVAIDQRFVVLEVELRRHFGVLIEDVRHDLRAVAEMVVANTEAITQLRLRLDAR